MDNQEKDEGFRIRHSLSLSCSQSIEILLKGTTYHASVAKYNIDQLTEEGSHVVAQQKGEVDSPARPTLHVPHTWPVFMPRLKKEVTETLS
jgi:hypothetical protein